MTGKRIEIEGVSLGWAKPKLNLSQVFARTFQFASLQDTRLLFRSENLRDIRLQVLKENQRKMSFSGSFLERQLSKGL